MSLDREPPSFDLVIYKKLLDSRHQLSTSELHENRKSFKTQWVDVTSENCQDAHASAFDGAPHPLHFPCSSRSHSVDYVFVLHLKLSSHDDA